MARCDVVLLASSVWRLAPQESVQRTVGSVKGAEGAELKESARERTAVKPPTPFDAQAETGRNNYDIVDNVFGKDSIFAVSCHTE